MTIDANVIEIEGNDFLCINGGAEYDGALINLNELKRIIKKGSDIIFQFKNVVKDEEVKLSASDISKTPLVDTSLVFNEIFEALKYGKEED